ncbi:Piso0_001845 [Millerozyma farinosa CBS 7064]|uniref:Piso0_001845 protein n=1 Tax=Pichia sorbitophila (strain ATCC MYA-4447 / BCRC 22081 / CBS 7064 / NBRC 10061 / NRRL Y-12695) TaxID=559304 RepID=G8YP89_PICSO|nr:Piso0_001845 [Millerozyma farinosa CBS 7064]
MDSSIIDEAKFSTPMSFKIHSGVGVPASRSEMFNDGLPTPLKKLSNNSLSNYKLPVRREQNPPKIPMTDLVDSGSSIQKEFSNDHKKDGIGADIPLKPLSEVASKFYQNKIVQNKFKDNQTNPRWLEDNGFVDRKQPIYYRPPSSSESIVHGIESFLPPNISIKNRHDEKKNRIPITFASRATHNSESPSMYNAHIRGGYNSELGINGLDDDEYPADDGPTGTWFNPAAKEALRLQLNYEKEVKRLLANILCISVTKLFVSSMNYLLVLYDRKSLPFQKQNAYYPSIRKKYLEDGKLGLYLLFFRRILYFFFFLNCVLSVYRLVRHHFRSFDLPLTAKQKELLGIDSTSKDFHNDHSGTHEQSVACGDVEVKSNDDIPLAIRGRRFQDSYYGTLKLPKYSKANVFDLAKLKHFDQEYDSSGIWHNESSTIPEPSITRSLPNHGEDYVSLHDPQIQSSFLKKYNISFNEPRNE